MALQLGYRAYLQRGATKFDLNDDIFELGDDFIPPSTQEEPLLAAGTSANRYGGSEKVNERAGDVSLFLPVVVDGGSEAKVRMNAHRLTRFLKSGRPSDPVYFCFLANGDIPFEPLWGQYGVPLKYEIIHPGTPQIDSFFNLGDTRELWGNYNTTLLLKPYAQGQKQRVGTAAGGILEDVVGSVDGRSRGLIIDEATTNLFPNPIFGHTTWNTGWTAASNLTATENIDLEFVAFGLSSARLTANGGAATTRLFTQGISVTGTVNYTLSAYVKLPNGGTVSATQCTLASNGAEVTPDHYIEIGNGLWRLDYNFTAGSDAVYNMGVCVQDGYTVYADGFQLEAKAYTTPLCHGDLLGHSWSGTDHNSSSTRTIAEFELPIADDTWSSAEGAVRVVWKPHHDHDALGAVSRVIWAGGIGGFQAKYNYSAQTYTFGGPGSSATSAGTYTFNAGDIIILHYTWSPANGVKIYLEGVEIASGSAYAPIAYTDPILMLGYLYGNEFSHGTYLDFSIYDREPTAAQVLADAQNVSAYVNAGDELGLNLMPIPWQWTKDGDNQVDNCDDSSRDNWTAIGGIAGTRPALTFIDGLMSQAFSTIECIWLSLWPMDYTDYVTPGELIYSEFSGTSDGGSSGGEYAISAVSTSGSFYAHALSGIYMRHWYGKSAFILTRLYDNGSNLTIGAQVLIGGISYDTDMLPISTTTAMRLYKSPAFQMLAPSLFFGDHSKKPTSGQFNLLLERTSGSANIHLDYFLLLPRPARRIGPRSSADKGFYIEGGRAASYLSALFPQPGPSLPTSGEYIELLPDKINFLISVMGSSSVTNTITWTLDYNQVVITPRWGLN